MRLLLRVLRSSRQKQAWQVIAVVVGPGRAAFVVVRLVPYRFVAARHGSQGRSEQTWVGRGSAGFGKALLGMSVEAFPGISGRVLVFLVLAQFGKLRQHFLEHGMSVTAGLVFLRPGRSRRGSSGLGMAV